MSGTSKQNTMKLSTGSTGLTTGLSLELIAAKKDDPIQWDLQCDIVRAAYEFSLKKGSAHTKKYMEEVMDDYGIERGIPQ